MKRQLANFLRSKRVLLLAIFYALTTAVTLYLAYEIRFDFIVPVEHQQERLRVLWVVVLVKLLTLVFAQQMGSMITFFGVPDFFRLTFALLASAAVLYLPRFTEYARFSPPRGVLLIDFLVCLSVLCSFRLGARLFRERVLVGQKMRGRIFERVAIIGAGDTGASLVNDLVGTPARGFRPVAILDDDVTKHGRFVHGVCVEGAPEEFATLPALDGVRHAIIAMPSAPSKRIAEIALFLGRLGVQVETVPALEDLASGKARVSRTRPIEIQDLLGRPVVSLDTTAIRHFVESKVVAVTGAGGSIGSELCRQIAALNPRRLLLIEQAEPSLFLIEQELIEGGFGGIILPVIADILDEVRMNHLFSTHTPQVVFHAAAHKHVYLMERQPAEAVKNNAVGTRKLAEIAIANHAEAFVLISTDKAVNPTNVMGASKRLAELHMQALHAKLTAATSTPRSELGTAEVQVDLGAPESKSTTMQSPALPALSGSSPVSQTKLMTVRFGNVLGSSGSVVLIFKKQIEAGGPVTVTHPEVTRYFMTIPEAVGLVLQASVLGHGGEIFVLDMGQPIKIIELAKNMIELSGFKVDEDIEIKFTGLKTGEKLFEEIQHHSEQHQRTNHPRIMRFVSRNNALNDSQRAIEELEPFVDGMSLNDLKRSLKAVIPEYEPCYE